MKRIMTLVLAVAAVGCMGGTTTQPASTQPQSQRAPVTVAILSFDSELKTPDNSGQLVADILSARLGATCDVTVVERQDIAKILAEQKLTLAGLVSADRAVQVGKLLGAKLLITGRISGTGNKVYAICKAMQTESGQVKGMYLALPQNISMDDLVDKIGDKLAESLPGWIQDLVPAADRGQDVVAALKKMLEGKSTPAIAVVVPEQHIGPRVIDPAVETEFKTVLTQAGATVSTLTPEVAREVAANLKDTAKTARLLAGVRYLICGEAFSESAGTVQGLMVAGARAEIQVIDLETGKVLVADRATTRAPDLAEHLAGKTALQRAGRELAARMLPKLVEQFPPAAQK